MAVAHASAPPRSALIVLLASRPAEGDAVEHELQTIPALSVGLFSTTQGTYTPMRMLRDLEHVAHLANVSGAPGRLAIVRLPAGPLGRTGLARLVRERPAGELVLILDGAGSRVAHELRWSAVAGLGPGGETLTSQTTGQRGIVAALDVAPTLLGYLRLFAGPATGGHPIRLDGTLDGAALRSLKARLEVIYPRRLPALACLLGAWALLLLAASGHRAWACRCGALALLWTPVATLLPAALEPSALGEYALIVGVSFALAASTDALLPWPRAPIAPAVAATLALSVDALAGTQLLIRSLLGPNPAYGDRFYGIGNELKSGLAVLVLAAAAGALYPTVRSRRAAATIAIVGALLAAVEGAARIGAGVGGVILVCAGTALATALLLPGPVSRGRVLAVLAAPLAGLLTLAAIDLATAHGAGHFTGSVLDARSLADVQDLMVRRYRASWQELGNDLMPLVTTAALLVAAAGIHCRKRLLAPVDSDPAWLAALAGGLATGVVGALVEDSGPVLLVVAVFTLACVLAYLWGKPLTQRTAQSVSRKPSLRRAVLALPAKHDLML